MKKIEKVLLSLLVAIVFTLNMSVPVVYAYVNAGMNDGSAAYCNLFCNLIPANDRDSKLPPCPHHAKKEEKKKKLSELFECKIVPASCHDIPVTQTTSNIDPCILSVYVLDNKLVVSSFMPENLLIQSQITNLSIERPPAILS
ncbi:MAG: hypothetical protein HY034_00905 [Nitrospirae bacterium]|nr:hypothetical protein [Nitrospirota bacterium]